MDQLIRELIFQSKENKEKTRDLSCLVRGYFYFANFIIVLNFLFLNDNHLNFL